MLICRRRHPTPAYALTSARIAQAVPKKCSCTEVTIDGEELVVMKESDVMGILEKSASKKKAA